MGYLYLAIAVIAEVVATSALKSSVGFTKPIPSIVVVVGYGVAFYCLALVLKSLPVGITYAIWAGMGIVLITMVGAVVYKEVPDMPALIGMALIISGVVIISLYSKTSSHS